MSKFDRCIFIFIGLASGLVLTQIIVPKSVIAHADVHTYDSDDFASGVWLYGY